MRAFVSTGTWESVRHHLVTTLRGGAEREPSPTAAIIDTQSVKTTKSGGPRGYDAAKKINTRRAAATVRRPGIRTAPTIRTSTCCHVGAVKAALNGSIQEPNLVCAVSPIRFTGIRSLPTRRRKD